MYRVAFFALLATAAFAQTEPPPPPKPPADVDQALRTRVNEFYKLLQEGGTGYRRAEKYISDDTQDYYYEGGKPVISNYELLETQYSTDFTHATVITKCGQQVAMPGLPAATMTVKMPTTWRIENGAWMLYVDREKILNPVGLAAKMAQEANAKAIAAGGIPKDIPTDAAFVMGKVKPDKTEVEVEPGGTVEVHISNSSPGRMLLQPGVAVPGVETILDRKILEKDEKALLTIKAGKEDGGGMYYLQVMPTQEIIRIAITVKKKK